jgi:hypothetical protein
MGILPWLDMVSCVALASCATPLLVSCRGGDALWRTFYEAVFGPGPAELSTKRGDVSSYYELVRCYVTAWGRGRSHPQSRLAPVDRECGRLCVVHGT